MSSPRSTDHSLRPSATGAARATELQATGESSHRSTATKEIPHSASLRTRSEVCCSVRSSSSSAESAAVRARARAEAAKARLCFAEEEANLRLQQAKLEVSIQMLKHKKEAAAAVAEAETLEAAADAKSERHSCDLNIDSVPLEASQRTKQYVLDQLKERDSEFESCKSGDMQAKTGPVSNHNVSPPPLKPEVSPSAFPTHHFRPQNHLTQPPPARHAVLPDFHDGSSHINDFVRYLARRELVATGLLQFNDKPQNYRAWRRSFLTTISGLNLTPSEEMDLLLKWLGKESAEHIEQIRAIHINRPEAGLAMAWERLELTYGSAEAIENALFKRIDSFPKIINRDGPKLTKLGDLLMELQAAKAEGDLPGLAFLDTARGVNPIVQKLPSRLQDKWVIAGAAYKSQNKGSWWWTITAANNKTMRRLEVFTEVLRFLKDDALKTIKHHPAGGEISASDFTWVLTVPRSLMDITKRIMTEAAVLAGLVGEDTKDKLVFALESAAALAWCLKPPPDGFITQNHSRTSQDQPPEPAGAGTSCNDPAGGPEPGETRVLLETQNQDQVAVHFKKEPGGTKDLLETRNPDRKRYLVVDCGDQSYRYTVHEVLEGGALKMLFSGALRYMGEKKFLEFLKEIFSDGVWEEYEQNFPREVRKIKFEFARLKHLDEDVQISCPDKLRERAQSEKDIETFFASVEGASWEDGVIKISRDKLRSFFDDSLQTITATVRNVLNKNSNIGFIVLVGGLAESQMLRQFITDQFGHQYKVLCPLRPQEAVLKGAVELGRNPELVQFDCFY